MCQRDFRISGLTICAVIFIFSSCKIYPPTIKSFDKIKVERNGITGYSVGTEVVIHNPNRVRLTINGLSAAVGVNGKALGTIGKNDAIVIKRNTDFAIPLSIEVKSIESMFKDMKSILGIFNSSQMNLSITGEIKLRAYCFYKRTFPFNVDQTVNLKDIR